MMIEPGKAHIFKREFLEAFLGLLYAHVSISDRLEQCLDIH